MKNNSFGKLAVVVAMVAGLLAAFASKGAAQIIFRQPPTGIVLQLPSPDELDEITAGAYHTCVRQYNGNVSCWGLNGWSTSGGGGQIGVASTTTCKDAPVQDPNHISIGPAASRPCVDTPRFVTQLTSFGSQIAAGNYHTCALTGGVASCWGSNLFGALGDGTQNDRSMPQNVSTSVIFTRLAAGDSGTCGLSQSGIFCWGYLPYDPNVSSSAVLPKQLSTFSGFTGVTLGSRFVCFVYRVGGYGENDCQGIDNLGQLGVVNTPGTPDAPSWMPHDSNNIAYANFIVGTSMSAASNVVRSSAAYSYVCGELSDGTVRCMGSNTAGQLGTSGGSRADAEPVVGGNGAAMQLHGVTTGLTHACALDAAGAAWCWGLGRYGEIGNATTGWSNQANYAQRVAGGLTFRALAAGDQHTCGIGTDNHVYCWGDNEYGQLGVGYHNLGFAGFSYVERIGTPQRVVGF